MNHSPLANGQVAKTIASFLKDNHYEHVNRALIARKRADDVLSEEHVQVLKGIYPIVQTFSDVCDAAGVRSAAISRWVFFLAHLWGCTEPVTGGLALPVVEEYKLAVRSSLAKVLTVVGVGSWGIHSHIMSLLSQPAVACW